MLDALRNLSIFVLMLGGLIFVHELGHFMAAVRCGIKVKEFGLGLPPRIFRLGVWRGTEFTLNWIPLGGFVRPEGEYDPAVPGGLAASVPWKRLAVFAAGPVSNFLVGYAVFCLAFMAGWPDGVRVVDVAPGSPAVAAGIQAGDVVVRADGKDMRGLEQLLKASQAKLGQPMTLELRRGGQALSLVMVPDTGWSPDKRPTGMTLARYVVQHSLWEAGGLAAGQVWAVVRETAMLPWRLSVGEMQMKDVRFSSPVGLKQVSDRVVTNTFNWQVAFPLLQLTAVVSVALGLTNILPLPALDGGRMAFVLLEMLRRRPVNVRREKQVHVLGMVALYGLMLALVVQDVMHPLF